MNSAINGVMLLIVAHVAFDHWRTMRKLEKDRPRSSPPSTVAIACDAIRKTEKWLPGDTPLIVVEKMTVTHEGERFVVTVQRDLTAP